MRCGHALSRYLLRIAGKKCNALSRESTVEFCFPPAFSLFCAVAKRKFFREILGDRHPFYFFPGEAAIKIAMSNYSFEEKLGYYG